MLNIQQKQKLKSTLREDNQSLYFLSQELSI